MKVTPKYHLENMTTSILGGVLLPHEHVGTSVGCLVPSPR